MNNKILLDSKRKSKSCFSALFPSAKALSQQSLMKKTNHSTVTGCFPTSLPPQLLCHEIVAKSVCRNSPRTLTTSFGLSGLWLIVSLIQFCKRMPEFSVSCTISSFSLPNYEIASSLYPNAVHSTIFHQQNTLPKTWNFLFSINPNGLPKITSIGVWFCIHCQFYRCSHLFLTEYIQSDSSLHQSPPPNSLSYDLPW